MKTKKWRWDSCDESFTDDEISHHGIKGMKWGVRRTPEQLGHKTGGRKYKIVKKSSYEKKMEKLARKEQKIAEKEAIKAKADELKFRKGELSNKSERDAAKAKRAEERAKAKAAEVKTNKKTDVPKYRDVKTISDEELSQILKRYNMEQQYSKMVAESGQNGKAWFAKMITDVGKQVAQEYTKKFITAAVNSAIEKAKQNQRRNSGGSSGSGGGP